MSFKKGTAVCYTAHSLITVKDEKHFEQHEISTTHTSQTHTLTLRQVTDQCKKLGRRKVEWWSRTFCYSKNTSEGTCGWEHHAHFLFTYTPAQTCGSTQTHIETLQADTQVHTPAGTHTRACICRDKHDTWLRVACTALCAVLFGSGAQFEWLLFFFHRVRGWRWTKMNGQTGMGVCACRVQEIWALLVTRLSFIMSDNINHKAGDWYGLCDNATTVKNRLRALAHPASYSFNSSQWLEWKALSPPV